MSNERFTPGPWITVPYSFNVESNSNGIDVCKCEDTRYCDETKIANAYLIAAAPEMYELLKQLHDALASVPVLQVEIDKVLKKARGEE